MQGLINSSICMVSSLDYREAALVSKAMNFVWVLGSGHPPPAPRAAGGRTEVLNVPPSTCGSALKSVVVLVHGCSPRGPGCSRLFCLNLGNQYLKIQTEKFKILDFERF